MNERGDPGVIPGGAVCIRGSKKHGEIKVKPSGAFEMAMKGRGDAGPGRCEEGGRKVDSGMRQRRKHERENGQGEEKGNEAIKGRCCLEGSSP